MKRFVQVAFAALFTFAPTVALAQTGPFGQIEREVIFLDEIYQEVGRWTYYCSGYVSEEGQFTTRTVVNEYGCD